MYNYILLITILTYLKKSASFLSDFCCNNNKNKLEQKKPPVFFKILKEPILVQKKYMPHMKALILSFFELEQQGRGIIVEGTCLLLLGPFMYLLKSENAISAV